MGDRLRPLVCDGDAQCRSLIVFKRCISPASLASQPGEQQRRWKAGGSLCSG